MIIMMATPIPCGMPLALDPLRELPGTTIPVHLSGRIISGTILAVGVRQAHGKFEFTIELPEEDETVASWVRMVGHGLRLSRAGAPESYAELDRILSGEASLQ